MPSNETLYIFSQTAFAHLFLFSIWRLRKHILPPPRIEKAISPNSHLWLGHRRRRRKRKKWHHYVTISLNYYIFICGYESSFTIGVLQAGAIRIPTSIFSFFFSVFFFSISIYRLPGVCHPPYLHTHWALRAKVSEHEKERYPINGDDVLRFNNNNNNNNSTKMKDIFRNFCLVCLLDGLFAFPSLQFSQIDAVIYSNYAIQWSIYIQ